MKVCFLRVILNGLKDSERPEKIEDYPRIGLSLFCKMKTSCKGRWFQDVEGIQKNAPAKLNAISSVAFDVCFVHPLKVMLQLGEFAWKKMKQFFSCFVCVRLYSVDRIPEVYLWPHVPFWKFHYLGTYETRQSVVRWTSYNSASESRNSKCYILFLFRSRFLFSCSSSFSRLSNSFELHVPFRLSFPWVQPLSISPVLSK